MTDDLAERPRAHHDLGGVSKFLCEPIDTGSHALTDFDREVDAIRQILGAKKLMTTDQMRRGIEAIPEAEYLRMGYYQKWMRSITGHLIERGVFTEAELAHELAQGAAQGATTPPATA